MIRSLLLGILFIASTSFAKTQFGEAISLSEPVSLKEALTQFEKKSDKEILVEAKVEKVCKNKGCWLAITQGDTEVRVTFKDYGFFVPESLVGKKVLIQGVFSKKKMTLEETKHYVKDEGGDPSKVTEAKEEIRMIASGVQEKA